ncbi:MAG: thiolase domain-containing protein [Nitrososphaerales archaeon]
MNKVCVIGSGSTKYGKLEESVIELAVNASNDAILSAKIEPKEIQYGFVSNVFGIADNQVHLAPVVMSNLGIAHVPGLTVESACGSGSIAFREAYANVAAGFYDVVIAVGVEKVTQTGTGRSTTLFSYCSDFFYEGGSGASFPGLFATMARAYLTRYKATEEDLAMVAVKNHEHGILNPKAHLQKRITVEDVLNSPLVASPLKVLDCCPFSDGASAVVLCSEDYAKKHVDYIEVIGSGRGASPAALQGREDVTTIPSTRAAAQQAYNQANLTPKDIDFAEVHDCFTIAEMIDTEDLGFFEKGMAAQAVREGLTKLNNGGITINPSGGLKSKGHPIGATGIGQIVEVYEQLLGRAGARQVKNAGTALTHNFGATGASCAVHIFRRV